MQSTVSKDAAEGTRSAPVLGWSDGDETGQIIFVIVDIEVQWPREMLNEESQLTGSTSNPTNGMVVRQTYVLDQFTQTSFSTNDALGCPNDVVTVRKESRMIGR